MSLFFNDDDWACSNLDQCRSSSLSAVRHFSFQVSAHQTNCGIDETNTYLQPSFQFFRVTLQIRCPDLVPQFSHSSQSSYHCHRCGLQHQHKATEKRQTFHAGPSELSCKDRVLRRLAVVRIGYVNNAFSTLILRQRASRRMLRRWSLRFS